MPKVNEEQCVVLECELPRSGCEYCERHHMKLCGQLHHRIRKGDEEQNSAVPSGQTLKDTSSDAAPSFTPGPWFNNAGVSIDGVKGKTIVWLDEDTKDADARLIAVAPELYAQLKKIYYDNEAACGCECDTENCCNLVGEPCAKCDARAPLAKVNAPKQEK